MFNNQIDNQFITLIKYMVSNGYKCKKESIKRAYQRNGILVRFDSNEIIIKDINDNRRYSFTLDTSDTFLVNFLTFLDNNYSEALI